MSEQALRREPASGMTSSWAHVCMRCLKAMMIERAEVMVDADQERFYECEYRCTCGYRQTFPHRF